MNSRKYFIVELSVQSQLMNVDETCCLWVGSLLCRFHRQYVVRVCLSTSYLFIYLSIYICMGRIYICCRPVSHVIRWGVENTHGECLSADSFEVNRVAWIETFTHVNISSVACGRNHAALVVAPR